MVYVDIKEGSGSGTTTDAYVTIETIDVRARRLLTMHVKNTAAANAMTYQVLGYAKRDGLLPTTEVSATDITFGNTAQIAITKKLATIVVQVKSKVAGTPATYDYEYLATVM